MSPAPDRASLISAGSVVETAGRCQSPQEEPPPPSYLRLRVDFTPQPPILGEPEGTPSYGGPALTPVPPELGAGGDRNRHQPVLERTAAMTVPASPITFLFTDIEGSTKLWEQHPEAMRLALARHDALMREAVTERRGRVFKTIGDAFCVAFTSAPDALAAALTVQTALSRLAAGRDAAPARPHGPPHRPGGGAGRRLFRPDPQPGRPAAGNRPRGADAAVVVGPGGSRRTPCRPASRCETSRATG